MCRRKIQLWILAPQHKNLQHRLTCRVKHVRNLCQERHLAERKVVNISKGTTYYTISGTKNRMIKLIPLSELAKDSDIPKTNNSNRREGLSSEDGVKETDVQSDLCSRVSQRDKSQAEQGMICKTDTQKCKSLTDQNDNASLSKKESKRETKRTIIPSDLLSNVAQTVKRQMDQGIFLNPEPTKSESLISQNSNASLSGDACSNFDIQLSDSCNDSISHGLDEDRMTDAQRGSRSDDVYNISVLFTGMIIYYNKCLLQYLFKLHMLNYRLHSY